MALPAKNRKTKTKTSFWKTPLGIATEGLAVIGAGCQLAGVSTMLIASIVLGFGLWIVPTIKAVESDRIIGFGRYRPCAIAGICAFTGFLAVLICGWISSVRSEELATQTHFSTPPSFAQLDTYVWHKGNSSLTVGHSLALNYFIKQYGPEPLHDVYANPRITVIEKPDALTDAMVLRSLEERVSYIRRQRDEGKTRGADIPVGGNLWDTFRMPPLTQEEVDGFLSGRFKLYFLVWVSWTDLDGRKGENVFCNSLQRPTATELDDPLQAIWHRCEKP